MLRHLLDLLCIRWPDGGRQQSLHDGGVISYPGKLTREDLGRLNASVAGGRIPTGFRFTPVEPDEARPVAARQHDPADLSPSLLPLPKRSLTVGLRFDVEEESGEISDANQEKLSLLLEFGSLTALDVVQDWIDELEFFRLRAVFLRAGEDARDEHEQGRRAEPSLADLQALYDEHGQPYNETLLAADFDNGAGSDLSHDWTAFALSAAATVIPFPDTSTPADPNKEN